MPSSTLVSIPSVLIEPSNIFISPIGLLSPTQMCPTTQQCAQLNVDICIVNLTKAVSNLSAKMTKLVGAAGGSATSGSGTIVPLTPLFNYNNLPANAKIKYDNCNIPEHLMRLKKLNTKINNNGVIKLYFNLSQSMVILTTGNMYFFEQNLDPKRTESFIKSFPMVKGNKQWH